MTSLSASREPDIVPPATAQVAPGGASTIVDPFDPVDLSWQRWFKNSGAVRSGNEVVLTLAGHLRPFVPDKSKDGVTPTVLGLPKLPDDDFWDIIIDPDGS